MYTSAAPVQYRACTYCASSHAVSSYREHLVTAHSDLLFHCEECDRYIDRKDFILHMSFHALQYTAEDIKRKKIKKKKEDVSLNSSPLPPIFAKSNDIIKPEVKTKTSVQENEFSDHSDVDGFEPLPESVFEAIEDSQDSQHVEYESSHTPENERCSDESNKCSQHENNLNNPDVCIDNHNRKLSNCSVVIEAININSTQMNIATKNDNLNNNFAIPTNKVPQETTDISNDVISEGVKRNHKKTRQCPFCPKEYTASSSYFYHLKYFHKGSKEHACEVCGRKFGTRACLTQHMAVHSGQYEFECSQCHKQFKSKASLYIHSQTHSGKKAWSCSQCHTSFRWKTHLSRHMKRHAAEKGHVCGTCGRGFSVRCDLLRHARTHSKGCYCCDKCGQKFAQLRYLKTHTTKQHSANIRKVCK